MEKLKIAASKLPQSPGVYQFLDKNSRPIYIGKAKNLKARVKSYFLKSVTPGPKTISMLKNARDINYILVESEIEALLLEAALIKKYRPKYNTVAKDDKSHLYIKITTGDKIPLITTTRKEKWGRGVKVFGPFTSASTVRSVLKILRRVFPFCTTTHGGKVKRKCLYCHLGLCPAPFESVEKMAEYRKTVKKIILFLQGKKKVLISKLKKEMVTASRKLEFEKAAQIKKQIEDLEYITTSYRLPEEYLRRPDLVEDVAAEKLEDLARILAFKKLPERIECYDISNISGRLATGSMVVFEKGLPAKEWYRKFKIKTKETPNDVAMMKEVLVRRFGNDWPLPDLIVVDGGKTQLSAVRNVLSRLNLEIPHIALAKRQEEIYLPNSKEPVKLNRSTQGLQLIQNLRDEAHRFAITYHKKLRSKLALS